MKRYSFKPFKDFKQVAIVEIFDTNDKSYLFPLYTTEENITTISEDIFDFITVEVATFEIHSIISVKEINRVKDLLKGI